MSDYINFRVRKDSLEEHVKRICRSNLKKPAKICTRCPFLGPVIEIMESNGWKYNTESMENHIRGYYSHFDS